jgi:hypothetical protein
VTTRKPTVGDLVEVLPPHGEAGARGVVEAVYRANEHYEPRARVRFHEPYGEGVWTIALTMLAVIS